MRTLAFLVATCAAFSPPASLLQRPAVGAAAPASDAARPTSCWRCSARADQIQFQLVMDAIDELDVREVNFSVRRCVDARPFRQRKILSFATYSKLEPAATLQLFGDYYRGMCWSTPTPPTTPTSARS